MKKTLFLLAALLGVTQAWAYTCKVDGICYNLNQAAKTATVTYSGYPHNNDYTGAYGSSLSGLDIVIPSTISYQDEEYIVTAIGEKAFYDSESTVRMSSVTIPSTVTSIGSQAFWKCTAITSITIPSSVSNIGEYAFYGCTGLTSLTIEEGVSAIGSGAFSGCSSLTSVIVKKESPVDIASSVFSNRANATLTVPYGCSEAFAAADYWKEFKEIVEASPIIEFADANVKALCIANWDTNGDGELSEAEAETVTSLDAVFKNNAYIGSFDELRFFTGLSAVNDNAFINCTNLSSIIIPESVTSIGVSAFQNCKSLASIIIPGSVTEIGTSAFCYCSGLTNITTPVSIKSIGRYAFRECSNIVTAKIECSGNLGYGVLYKCNSLKSLEINCPVVSNIFQEVGANYTNHGLPDTLEELVLGEKVEEISGFWQVDRKGVKTSTTVTYQSAKQMCQIQYATASSNPIYDAKTAYIDGEKLRNIIIPDDVVSIGSFAFINCTSLQSITMPTLLTNIGQEAFCGCSSLATLSLPDGIKNIGEGAFTSCIGLTKIIVPDELETLGEAVFAGCNNLVEIALPTNLTSIGRQLFYKCSALNTINFPNNLKSIGTNAFYGCNSLVNATLPEGLESLGYQAFCKTGLCSVVIPSSVSSFGGLTFYDCNELISVTAMMEIPVSIESTTFSNCANATLYVPHDCKAAYEAADYWKEFKEIKEMSQPVGTIFTAEVNGLQMQFRVTNAENFEVETYGTFETGPAISKQPEGEVVIPVEVNGYTVVGIGGWSFYGCSGLTSITIPNSVTSIGSPAFSFCSGLTSITIPNSVTSIGEGAFSDCSGLTSISVASGNTKYDSRDDCNAIIETASNKLIVGCNNTVIPSSVTSIGVYAFKGSGLKSITIPESVTDIEMYPFEGCINLERIIVEEGNAVYDSRDNCNAIIGKRSNILIAGCKNSTIPDGVTGIWQEAFLEHTGLTSIYIPNSVVSIGQQAFFNCSGLFFVAIGNSVTNIGNSAFAGCNNVRDVYCFAESIPTTGVNAFRNTFSATLHVPAASLETYRETIPWSYFKNIVPLTDEELTGVERIDNEQLTMPAGIYDLNGRRLMKMQRGLNIVRYADGKVRKVMVK